MESETFIDTSGFYALLVRKDDQHAKAKKILQTAASRKFRFVTTDYVLDETATLLIARGWGTVVPSLFETIFASHVCRLEWTDQERFEQTVRFVTKTLDQGWSFTDCLSFCVMQELQIHSALTKDRHFNQAGFRALLL